MTECFDCSNHSYLMLVHLPSHAFDQSTLTPFTFFLLFLLAPAQVTTGLWISVYTYQYHMPPRIRAKQTWETRSVSLPPLSYLSSRILTCILWSIILTYQDQSTYLCTETRAELSYTLSYPYSLTIISTKSWNPVGVPSCFDLLDISRLVKRTSFF